MRKFLRVGVVGLGRIFDLHARGYLGNPDAKIVCLCDLRDSTLTQAKKMFPDAQGVNEYQQLLEMDLDLIEILSPHPAHRDMTVRALETGAHVSVQKPMAMTIADCDAMIEASHTNGRRLKLFENFVFYPPLVKARELLMSGEIGAPKHFRMKTIIGDRSNAWHVPVETNAWRQELGRQGAGGPIIFDHGHHLIAVALWLFGDVQDCFALLDNTALPDGSVLDAPASIAWRHREPPAHTIWDVSLASKMKVRTDYYASHEKFEIQGERGIITVNRCSDRLLDEPPLTLYRDGEVRSWHDLNDDWGESFRRSTLHFIDVLKGREEQQILTGEEGRRVIELYMALRKSSETGRLVEPSGCERPGA